MAGELARADGDYRSAFAAYERLMMPSVLQTRTYAEVVAKRLVPTSTLGVRGLIMAGRVLSLTPTWLIRAVATRKAETVRVHDVMPVPDYSTATLGT